MVICVLVGRKEVLDVFGICFVIFYIKNVCVRLGMLSLYLNYKSMLNIIWNWNFIVY